MKYNRATLNEEVAKLRNQYELADTMPIPDVFNHNIHMKFQAFIRFCDKPRTEEEKKAMLAPVNVAISMYNDEMRNQRVETLLDMKFKDAFADYLRTQKVPGCKLVNDKETGYHLTADNDVYLEPYDVISALCATELDGILDMVCIWADNLSHLEARDDTKNMTVRSIHRSYIDYRKRLGWDIPAEELSFNKLLKQLNELAAKITCGTAPDLAIGDLKYIRDGIRLSKDMADKGGVVQVRDEKTIIKYIFRAIFTRVNSLAYDTVSNTNAGKENAAPRSMKANKTAGESPMLPEFTPAPVVKAGPVTVGKAPAKKPATKKPATKK